MTAAFCHSDDKRNLNVIPTEKLFASTRNLCAFDKKRFFSREKLFQNDSSVLSFRQRSFLLRRGISVSFRQRSSFDFDEESFSFLTSIDYSVAKSSFRMTVAFYHSDDKRNLNVIPTEEPFLLRRGIYVLSIKRDSSVAKGSFRMIAAKYLFKREAFFMYEIQILAKYIIFVLWTQKPYKHPSNT
jgi:hypothetical protein